VANLNDDIYKYAPLWGNWYIELPLGKGSFGSVYKISREEMGHKYSAAVKIISVPSEEQYREAENSLGSDEATLSLYFEDVIKSIITEINVLYSLSGNSNIINYQDHKVIKKEDQIGWDILIRMEYVTSLRLYQKDHQMSREEIIRLGIDLCSALEICSKKGIIHRDIKDENIFVNEDGAFKLGDFGIARELSKSGRAASMRGTPLYMAPEVYRGDKYDAAVDIYSLGIVLYKLVNHGRMPFMPTYPAAIRFKDSEEALERRMSGEKLPVPDQAGAVLSRVIMKACEYKAEERYSSPTEMKRDLENIMHSLTSKEREELVTPLGSKLESPGVLTDRTAKKVETELTDSTVSVFEQRQTLPQTEEIGRTSSTPHPNLDNTGSIWGERLTPTQEDLSFVIIQPKSPMPAAEVVTPSEAIEPAKPLRVIALFLATILMVLTFVFGVYINLSEMGARSTIIGCIMVLAAFLGLVGLSKVHIYGLPAGVMASVAYGVMLIGGIVYVV
jgi:serine/threonine protein kinase